MAQFFERWDWPENACQYHLPRRERSTPGGSLSPSPVSSIYFNMLGRLFALWRTTAGEGKVIILGELQACILQSYTICLILSLITGLPRPVFSIVSCNWQWLSRVWVEAFHSTYYLILFKLEIQVMNLGPSSCPCTWCGMVGRVSN